MANESTLAPLEEYLSSGVHIGTKHKNGHMAKFILRSRADGLKILDTEQIDERLKVLISYLSRLEAKDFAIMGRRENVKKPLTTFAKIIGCDIFTGRYLPGKLTNASLDTFKEYKAVIVCDPLTDKNILQEAFEQGIFTIGFCDTNNKTMQLDLVIPINNKGKRSMGIAFYLLAKHYLANRGILKEKDFTYTVDDFVDE
jgi:small subunit ribosomal protein S2